MIDVCKYVGLLVCLYLLNMYMEIYRLVYLCIDMLEYFVGIFLKWIC